ncbi:YaiO family outer membrane beta-barrel protein [Gillisia limnaea]
MVKKIINQKLLQEKWEISIYSFKFDSNHSNPTMNHKILCLLGVFIFSFTVEAQEITETNSDIIYQRALEAYKNEAYSASLKLTKRGLELAPEYHDIRILQIRNLWALEELQAADSDLDYLLKEAPEYVDVKPLVYQRINKFENSTEVFNFIDRLSHVYPEDTSLNIRKAQALLKDKQRKEARALAMELIAIKGISGADRYVLQTLLNRTVSDEIGLNYQYINFSEDYSRNDSWNSISAEYQHNFNRTAVIGRVNYVDRSYQQGTLYELEAYPVFSDRLYTFTNIGVSNGTMFPDVRTSASVFYNFAKVFEAEAGGRMLFFNDNAY